VQRRFDHTVEADLTVEAVQLRVFEKIQTYFSTNDLDGKYIDRNSIIEQIFQKYRDIYESGEFYKFENSLSNIRYDIVGLIGTHQDLMENNTEGEKLYTFLESVLELPSDTDIPDDDDPFWDEDPLEREESIIKNLLMNVPLYFLMAFLGHASDLEHNAKETKAKATKDAGLSH
tara:strand:- start:5297 stop:5818 length:522 start_codon:yes stop_codon:yes gene_type:complete